MVKVRIPGYNRQEGYRVFEVLDRKEVEKILEDLDPVDIWDMTYNEGDGYSFSGTAYTYLDARDGKIYTAWLQQNTTEHPWSSFYKIILCSMKTGDNWWDFMTPDELLDWDEQEEFWGYNGTLEEFIAEKHGEEELQNRIENAKDYWAYEFNFDWDYIKEQLDYLYSFIIED